MKPTRGNSSPAMVLDFRHDPSGRSPAVRLSISGMACLGGKPCANGRIGRHRESDFCRCEPAGVILPEGTVDGRDRSLLPQCYRKERKMVDQTGIEPVTS